MIYFLRWKLARLETWLVNILGLVGIKRLPYYKTRLQMEDSTMSRCVIGLGYKQYIVDTEDAIRLADMLSKAEMFESKYNSGAGETFHVWEQEDANKFQITILPDSVYRIGKLAGKPEEKK